MSDVFISYARSTEPEAERIAAALRALGHKVWRDDDLPAHRAYAEVIEERLRGAKAVVVVWSQDAVKSQWVRAEANVAREAGTLVQLRIDEALPPLPFNEIQCADLVGWLGEADAPGWRKVLGSIDDLVCGTEPVPVSTAPAPAPQPSRPSIAVMPFATAVDDPDGAYFSEGVMDEIVASLSRFRQFFVLGGESTRPLQMAQAAPKEIGRKLGVRYVLEGNVRRAADRVRVAVKLLDTTDGSPVWAHSFDDTLEDVFALQDRIANAVAAIMEPALEDAEIKRVSRRTTDSLGAYDLYLRAVHAQRNFERTSRNTARELIERAIELDPQFSLALARLSLIRAICMVTEELELAEAHRATALELADRAARFGGDDALALALCSLALSLTDQNLERPRQLAERAIALNPASSNVRFYAGGAILFSGDADAAVAHFEVLQRLAPHSPVGVQSHFWMAVGWFLQGRFEDAAAKIVQTPHPRAFDFALLASIYGRLGRKTDAREMLGRFGAAATRPVERGADYLRTEEHQRLFQDGVALALQAV